MLIDSYNVFCSLRHERSLLKQTDMKNAVACCVIVLILAFNRTEANRDQIKQEIADKVHTQYLLCAVWMNHIDLCFGFVFDL